MFTTATTLLGDVAADVLNTIRTVWPFLAISILAAAALKVYVGTARLERLLRKRLWIGIIGAVALATLTPFCSCGTTAVLLGGLAASAPWAPLVAFIVSSPLTSPSELVLSGGLFGWPFALTFFAGTVVIGVAAGAITSRIDRTGWLAGQARLIKEEGCATGSCSVASAPVAIGVGPGTASVQEIPSRASRLPEFIDEVRTLGRRLILFFLAFTAVGYLVIEAIPTSWITASLGGDSLLAVPLAAILGVPVYISTEGSLPLVATLMDGGMGPGPALAFLVTGAGTSIGAVTGLLMIAKRRVVGLVVAILLASALVLGWLGQLVL